MADLYSIVPGLQLTADELMQAELVAQQILQAQFPDLDLRQGTALRDLVIRPTATLLGLINKGLNYYFIQNTISGINDNSPSDLLDSILSNWFLTRKLGTNAVINARLYFARQKNISLTADVFFSPDNALKYYPTQSFVLPSGALTYDMNSDEYYVDVDLVAEAAGPSYNISTGSLLYFTNFDPYFLRAEINFLKLEASDAETNSQFIQRAQTAISTRNLINVPSIISNLQENFTSISQIQPIGMSDPEMIRDVVYTYPPQLGVPVPIHIGGTVDIYCKSALLSSIIQLTADPTGRVQIIGPVYKVIRSDISGGSGNDTIPFNTPFTLSNNYTLVQTVTSISVSNGVATVTLNNHGLLPNREVVFTGVNQAEYNNTAFMITGTTQNTFTFNAPSTNQPTGTIIVTAVDPAHDYGLSHRQTLNIDFGNAFSTGTASFEIYYFDAIDDVQVYLDDSTNRVLSADLIAREFNTYLLDVSITGYNGPAPDYSTVLPVVQGYIDSLIPGQTFILADLQNALGAAGITGIKTPISVTWTLYTRDLMTPKTGTITDYLNPNDRTAVFTLENLTTANASAL